MNSRSAQISVEEIADGIRRLSPSDSTRAQELIESHLESRLQSLSPAEKLEFLAKLRDAFKTSGPKGTLGLDSQREALSDFFSLLLGQKISNTDLASAELSRKLAESLNTVFDSLNELVGVIKATLLGTETGLETIRHIIRADIRAESESKSLEAYLGQIKEAFLIANQAFKSAARNEVSRILAEFDPDHIASEAEKGMKFGFMRKAELFEVYREKFEQFKKWFESERFMEEFSREFERVCQGLYSRKGGRNEKAF